MKKNLETIDIDYSKVKLIVTDIDNTVFDWVSYYVNAFAAMVNFLSDLTKIPYSKLASEARDVFTNYASTEFPFLAQEMPSIVEYYKYDIERMLVEAVDPARDAFLKAAEPYLTTYSGVIETFATLRKKHPNIPIAALTDAPRYVAMWKLNKLKILNYFHAVYGLGDPRIPVCKVTKKIKVHPDLLVKHLERKDFGFTGKIRVLPDDYEKPGTKGFKTVLMDYDLDEKKEDRASVLWIGDNRRKDVALGNKVGVMTCWARYGTKIDSDLLRRLNEFSPIQSIAKNAQVKTEESGTKEMEPTYTIDAFSQIVKT